MLALARLRAGILAGSAITLLRLKMASMLVENGLDEPSGLAICWSLEGCDIVRPHLAIDSSSRKA